MNTLALALSRSDRFIRPSTRIGLVVAFALWWSAGILNVLVRSYGDVSGLLTHDSVVFLRLSENLIRGYGLTMGHRLGDPFDASLVGSYTPGYPLLIAAFRYATGADAFLASKLVNIFAFGATLIVFLRVFGSHFPLYGALLMTWSVSTIFAYTLSEAPFIVCLLGLAIALHRFHTGSHWWSLGILACCLLLFAFRYQGVFSLIAPGLLSIYYLFQPGQRRRFLVLTAVNGACAAVFAAYLLWTAAGDHGVHERARESAGELLRMVIGAQFDELALVTHYIGATAASRIVWAAGFALSILAVVRLLTAIRAPVRARSSFSSRCCASSSTTGATSLPPAGCSCSRAAAHSPSIRCCCPPIQCWSPGIQPSKPTCAARSRPIVPSRAKTRSSRPMISWDSSGPTCSTSDTMARARLTTISQ